MWMLWRMKYKQQTTFLQRQAQFKSKQRPGGRFEFGEIQREIIFVHILIVIVFCNIALFMFTCSDTRVVF